LKYVNPFIGTGKTKITSFWGGDGGTYPGAVAPFGFMQLTPETSLIEPSGYNFSDSSVFYFSCTNHLSGYPNGSSGRIYVMPVEKGRNFEPGKYDRSFSHQDEKSEPGYYRILFRDDKTLVEVSSSERAGMFRFTFPPKMKPRIFLGDLGRVDVGSKRMIKGSFLHTVILFNNNFLEKQDIPGECILTFPAVDNGENVLLLKIGSSMIDFNNTLNNISQEVPTWDFDHFKAKNQQKWTDALSVIEVEDTSTVNKTIFYTALYHSFLVPWIVSDVNGKYRGADKMVHQTKGNNQYGEFSPWDTFRSLHPLLCLLAPERQNDIILSMLNQFEQTGKLPKGPMTGNHIIPIIVDSYLKGVRGYDSTLAYNAMKACFTTSSDQKEFSAYQEFGYIPLTYSESVTQTVEFAYNDWALAQFAGKVTDDKNDYKVLLDRSFNYRNLFHAGSLFLLPRNGKDFVLEPVNFGYKEGDKWSYSMFVPHNPRDLINLMGGNDEYAAHLDSVLTKEYIVFDNEPVLHVPYLFNYAHHPELSQKWVRNIMKSHYTTFSDGVPGNDDLGSMSSWYVFSAMGFFPVCPGRPLYDFGSPIFKRVTVHFLDGKKFIINSENNAADHYYVSKVLLNGKDYNKTWISHSTIAEGGEITFVMDKNPASNRSIGVDFVAPSETKSEANIKVESFHFSKKHVEPNEPFWTIFTLSNNGSMGIKIVRLNINGKEYARKNVLVGENQFLKDSIESRLYPVGKHNLKIDDFEEKNIEVIKPVTPPLQVIGVSEIQCDPIFKSGVSKEFHYLARNFGGYKDSTVINVMLDDSVIHKDMVVLEPGEVGKFTHHLPVNQPGFHQLSVGSANRGFKIYEDNVEAKVIDISLDINSDCDTVPDKSGLLNHGIIHGNKMSLSPAQPFITDSIRFIEFRNAKSLDNLGEKITVMAWIFPTGQNKGLSDILTKGDFIALQSSGNKSLSFFAGGWGRGSCTVPLPENWVNNWHHVAGVSDGKSLKIFIDGIESGKLMINSSVNLLSKAKWMIGRNEEFPDKRFFNGYVDQFKVFVEPLIGSEIKREMNNSRPKTEF
jgi:putative alpha-1,2-mannosidase